MQGFREGINMMSVFSRIISKYKYKKALKKSCIQLVKCLDLYQRNEVVVKEIERTIEEDKKLLVKSGKSMTNKEKIQSMSTEELAFLLSYFSTCDHCIYIEDECAIKPNYKIHCEKGIAAWLEQEVTVQK